MAVKVVLGMSGGVDSAVSAWLLKEQGYDVTGVFMKNWEDDDDSEYCSSRQDFLDAASAAEKIGIDLEAVNFAKEYKERVFSEIFARISGRPHAQSGRAVQFGNQVQRVFGLRDGIGCRENRHRPLCARTPDRQRR